jgi:hypothetical protein
MCDLKELCLSDLIQTIRPGGVELLDIRDLNSRKLSQL